MHSSRIAAADRTTGSPDHALIAAAAATRQARTRTARAAAALDRPQAERSPAAGLVALLRTGRVREAGGSFHDEVARRG